MDTGQTPDLQGETEESCVTLENGTLANTGAGCVTVSPQNPESRAAHTQQDLLAPQKEAVDVDI